MPMYVTKERRHPRHFPSPDNLLRYGARSSYLLTGSLVHLLLRHRGGGGRGRGRGRGMVDLEALGRGRRKLGHTESQHAVKMACGGGVGVGVARQVKAAVDAVVEAGALAVSGHRQLATLH